jgi:hypothetical protein
MATENPGPITTKQAGTNVTNKRFVKAAAGGIVDRTTAATDRVTGVVAMRSTGFTGTTIPAGEPAPVCEGGTVLVEAGAAVADLAEVMSDASGRAITFAAGGGALAVGVVTNGTSSAGAGTDLSIRLYALREQHV